MLKYELKKVFVPEKYHKKIKDALSLNHPASIKINLRKPGDQEVLLTPGQIQKINSAHKVGRRSITVRMTRRQVAANLRHQGGFLSILASLAAKVLPTLLTGLATGLISAGTEKLVSGKGLYLGRRGEGCEIRILDDGLKLIPSEYEGVEGLYAKTDTDIIGSGLLLGPNSPFKNIPLLNLIL